MSIVSFYPDNVRLQGIWLLGLLSLAVTTGCSAAPVGVEADEMAAPEVQIETSAESTPALESESDRAINIPAPGIQQSPQLVKHASLHIELAEVDEAIAAISEILTQYQGDLLQLSEQESHSGMPHQVSLQLRVPQNNLDAALVALRALGTVENQSITAEDVSMQLVDLQARIRNLRKSEEALLEIMERSGSIAEVLEVSRELSTIREAIERNDAQLKSLQSRVAYSTIALTLVSTQPPKLPVSSIQETLSDTWQDATASVRTLSVGLLQLVLWLLVFSPYIGVLVLGTWAGRRYWRTHRPAPEQSHSN